MAGRIPLLPHPEGLKFIFWIEIEPAKQGIRQLSVCTEECKCGGHRGWGGATQPTSPAWASPQDLPNFSVHQQGRVHGQGTSYTTGSDRNPVLVMHCCWSLERAGLLCRPLRAPQRPQGKVCKTEEQGQSKKTRPMHDPRSWAMPSHHLQLPDPAAGDRAGSRASKAMPACSRRHLSSKRAHL